MPGDRAPVGVFTYRCGAAVQLLAPYPDGELIAQPIERLLNNPGNDDATIVTPAGDAITEPSPEVPPDEGKRGLFD